MCCVSQSCSVVSEVRTFVMNERAACLSAHECKFRLRGYGYGVPHMDAGQVSSTLPHGVDLCTLD